LPTQFKTDGHELEMHATRCLLAIVFSFLLPVALAQSATSLADVKLPTLTPEMDAVLTHPLCALLCLNCIWGGDAFCRYAGWDYLPKCETWPIE